MKIIYSAGHSTRSFNDLINLIESVDFDLLVDVRSKPRSRFSWFNKANFEVVLADKYIWMPSLGGLDKSLTEEDFQNGIDKLIHLADTKKIVLLCSEKDYKKCHRHTKLEPELRLQGYNIIHL